MEAQIEFLQIFRKNSLGNVLKILHINFHRASVTRNLVDDAPILGHYFLMGFQSFFRRKKCKYLRGHCGGPN